jgi:lipopolysaccharide transport system ATP-binding protein
MPQSNNVEDAVRLENVTVRYRAPSERIDKFKEYAIRRLQGKISHKHFLALQDVSFTVKRGEVFGLIGHNGAGKSTLLKLISRVLQPSSGRVWVNGRVAPLLEIGAGFHPELTGRENIYLNGALLGFSRREMDAKFESIVDFAELWDFIDAPLRTYSSGMWARLGFAVATDSQPEILIVDEILSVGDESFQRKSYERIESFRQHGATILLVSHSMPVVENTCQRAAWLEHGKLMAIGSAKEVVDRYLRRVREDESQHLSERPATVESNRWGTRRVEIVSVRITNAQGAEQGVFNTDEALLLHIDYLAHEPVQSPVFGMAIYRQDGAHVTGPNTGFAKLDLGAVAGPGTVTYKIPHLPLLDGLYHISVATHNQADTEIFDYHDRMYPFRVMNPSETIHGKYGLVTVYGEWQHVRHE